MPFPLIPVVIGLVSLVSGGTGVYKGAKAIRDNSKAKNITKDAREIIDTARRSLEAARDRSKKALENLGNEKLLVCQTSISKFVDLFDKIKNVELKDSVGLKELSKFKIDKQAIKEFKDISMMATSFAAGTLSGAVAGGAIAFGAYSAAGAFAAASTGTAIAGLSGAAATNATLAFFGGGALAAGGMGIAGGTAVLGGLVAGPALAVIGLVMGAKASKNLDNAYSNLAKAEEASEETKVLVTACGAIAKRARLFNKILIKLDMVFSTLLEQLERVEKSEGIDYSKYSEGSKEKIMASLSMAQAVKAILDTPLLDKNGKLTDDSKKVAKLICEKYRISA